MKVVICGSRSILDPEIVAEAIQESGFDITEVISGGAVGVDSLGAQWAIQNNKKVIRMLPDWKSYGKMAGLARNSLMVEEADAVIAIWDGKSRGTMDTITKTKKKAIPLYIKKHEEKAPEVAKRIEE